jgi:transposase InsO family protein
MSKLPDSPWKEVSVDFCGPFKTGEYLLVVIDDYSRYPEVEIVHSTSAQAVFPKLDAIFSRQGVPEIVRSDNGPPFNSEQFSRFARTLGFTHRKVTPAWPQSNGEVERFMRTLGKAVRTAQLEGSWKQELSRFLRHYRATPHSTTSMTPSELLNGRKLRTEMPSLPTMRKTVTFTDRLLHLRDQCVK